MALFASFVCDSATTCIDCQCGRIWFTHEDEDYEALLEKAKADPRKFCESLDDSVSFGVLSGRQIVFECGCGFIEKHEQWILQNEESIRRFLKAIGEERVKEAERLAAIQ